MKDRRKNGEGTINKDGYVVFSRNNKLKYQHIEIAERALGKSLPLGAQVHHVDGNPGNNVSNNLVICQDAKYHRLLHRRTAAHQACGDANYLKCRYCGNYSPLAQLKTDGSRSFSHPECRSAYRARRLPEAKSRGKRV